jgi:hypothetical protein
MSRMGAANDYRSSLDLLIRDVRDVSGFKEQYKKCRRGPVPAPAATATRTPKGAVSVPLPRTPKENILSKTGSSQIRRRTKLCCNAYEWQ